MDFYSEIIAEIKIAKNISKAKINKLKFRLAGKYNLKEVPTDIEVLLNSNKSDFKLLKNKLMSKPTRTGSGVAVVAIMTSPKECPHAKTGVGPCLMCPGGPKSAFGNIPQSYTGKEPATMRAIRNRYDPYLQVMNRLEQYIAMGQSPQKVELIIMGGTLPSYNKLYKESFIAYAYAALNDFSSLFYKKGELDLLKYKDFFMLPGKVDDKSRAKKLQEKMQDLKKLKKRVLSIELSKNESSLIKCVGLTIETRPDYGKLMQGNEMLTYGCTRVELGIQATDDEILKFIRRGHSVADSIESTRILKDLGFKINYHMMPGLPLSDEKKDVDMLNEIVSNRDFKPDMLKIYPAMVMNGTALYELWKTGKYTPLTTQKAAEIISEFKRNVPYWMRIMRVQRDIPTNATIAGVDRTNLRQYVTALLKEKGIECKCIRCREPKSANINGYKIFIEKYDASRGVEYFISVEDSIRKTIYGFCRMRFPSQLLQKEITNDSALIRELHVYGQAAELGDSGSVQHRGLGKKLLKKAEEIAKANKKNKIVVISGVGVRSYYRKLGYKKEGPYMVKRLLSQKNSL
ncbi:MAG: tRNA uridine(34) 5-carboxymethylaminomethyl modification radical SAM/GNAT enzyme Elp3 [archaeon]